MTAATGGGVLLAAHLLQKSRLLLEGLPFPHGQAELDRELVDLALLVVELVLQRTS